MNKRLAPERIVNHYSIKDTFRTKYGVYRDRTYDRSLVRRMLYHWANTPFFFFRKHFLCSWMVWQITLLFVAHSLLSIEYRTETGNTLETSLSLFNKVKIYRHVRLRKLFCLAFIRYSDKIFFRSMKKSIPEIKKKNKSFYFGNEFTHSGTKV